MSKFERIKTERDGVDTRAKLNEDAKSLQEKIWYAGKNHEGISLSHMMELLDRQAVITEHEAAEWREKMCMRLPVAADGGVIYVHDAMLDENGRPREVMALDGSGWVSYDGMYHGAADTRHATGREAYAMAEDVGAREIWRTDAEVIERLSERVHELTAERDKLEDELADSEELVRALRRERDGLALDLKRAQLLAEDLEAELDCLTGARASVDLAETVEHPAHYTAGGIECIDALESALTPDEFRGYCKGNIMKYVWRERHKGGAESIAKARWYIERLAEDGR